MARPAKVAIAFPKFPIRTAGVGSTPLEVAKAAAVAGPPIAALLIKALSKKVVLKRIFASTTERM